MNMNAKRFKFILLLHMLFIIALIVLKIWGYNTFISLGGIVFLAVVLFITDVLVYAIFSKGEHYAELLKRDSLTGLYNRKFFYSSLKNLLSTEKYELSVFILDIDDFKKVNDSFGHVMGDRVLKVVSKVLCCNLRKSDIVARYGGEEFAVVLTKCDVYEAYKLAERLRRAVEKCNFNKVIEGLNDVITISIGIAVFPHDGTTSVDLVKAADEAMYNAKRQGKNCVVIYKNRQKYFDTA